VAKRGLANHVGRRRRTVDPDKAAEFEARFESRPSTPSASRPTHPTSAPSPAAPAPSPKSRADDELVTSDTPKRSTKKRRASAGKRFVVLLPPETISSLRMAAATDGRSLSNAVEAAIAHWLASGRPDPLEYE